MFLYQPVLHGRPQPGPAVVTSVPAARHHLQPRRLPPGQPPLPLRQEVSQVADGVLRL